VRRRRRRRRELVCADCGHESKLLEAWLGMREHFFFLMKKYNSKCKCQILYLMGKIQDEKMTFFC